MKVYNREKTQELTEYDLNKGYLIPETIVIGKHEAQEEVQEKSHYEIIATYPNGGKDMRKIIEVEYVPAKEAYDETENIKVYIPFTQEELDLKRIGELREFLDTTWRWQNERYTAELKEIELGLREETTQTLETLIMSRKKAVDEINSLQK